MTTQHNTTQHNFRILILILFGFLFNSCETEKIDQISESQNYNDEVSVKNGRLFFQSKESLVRIYQKYAEASDDKINNFLEPLIKIGFHSLRPIVTKENESLIYQYYVDRISKYNYIRNSASRTSADISNVEPLDYLDQIEEVIGDDTYAALLNPDGEIQIANEIYKYTDVGLFIAKEDKFDVLQDYLVTKNISNVLEIPTPEIVKTSISELLPENGITTINSDLTYFKVEEEVSEVPNSTSKYSQYSNSAKTSTYDPNYNTFLSNLTSCSPHRGLFGNLFGDNNVCIDKYETRRRVKTKAFNYNYLAVYHMGVKCVNQYRGWTGFWRVDATDELKVLVEAAQFEYDVDKLINAAVTYNQLQERAYYLNDQKILYQPNNINIPNFSYTNLAQSSLPQIFQNSGQGLTFEFFGTGSDNLDVLIEKGIQSSLNAKALNDHFYNGLYSIAVSQLRTALNEPYNLPENRTFVARFTKTGKLIVQKSVSINAFNIGVFEKTFDFGAEIKLSANASSTGTWSVSNIGPGNQLIRPKNFRMKIIGAIRYGDTWHGSKFQSGIAL